MEVGGSAVAASEVTQPTAQCHDQCGTYATLFNWMDVKALVRAGTDGELENKVTGNSDNSGGVDYCGAGDNVKVVFTLMY